MYGVRSLPGGIFDARSNPGGNYHKKTILCRKKGVLRRLLLSRVTSYVCMAYGPLTRPHHRNPPSENSPDYISTANPKPSLCPSHLRCPPVITFLVESIQQPRHRSTTKFRISITQHQLLRRHHYLNIA